jgi:hypothetical protein
MVPDPALIALLNPEPTAAEAQIASDFRAWLDYMRPNKYKLTSRMLRGMIDSRVISARAAYENAGRQVVGYFNSDGADARETIAEILVAHDAAIAARERESDSC